MSLIGYARVSTAEGRQVLDPSQRAAGAVSSGRGWKPGRRARRGALFPPVQPPPCDRGLKHSVFSGVCAYDNGMSENYSLFT